MSVAGKVVIVTGAARGLGREYAQRYAADGASVVLADVLADDVTAAAAEMEAAGAAAVAAVVDVTDPAATTAMADTALGAFGRIDVLVNNAGVWGDLQRTPLLEIDPSYWDLVMAINTKGPLLCSRAVAPAMIEQGSGRIINISSMGAYMPSGVYGVSKMAVHHLTVALAAELGPKGITVNAVGPGMIDNEASRRQMPQAGFDKLLGNMMIKRAGGSADIYGMLKYLSSDEAEWVTAQVFLVNGGFNYRF